MPLELWCKSRIGIIVIALWIVHALLIIMLITMVVLIGWFLSGSRLREEYSKPYTASFNEHLKDLELGKEADFNNFDILLFHRPLAVAGIITTLLMFFAVMFGAFAALKIVRNMLLIYIMLLLVLFICYLALFFTFSQGSQQMSGLKTSMYKSFLGHQEETCEEDDTQKSCLFWNAFMIHKQCCGVLKGKYLEGRNFVRNVTLKHTVIPVQGELPIVCCHKDVLQNVSKVLETYIPLNATAGQLHEDKRPRVFDPNHPAIKLLDCTKVNSTHNNLGKDCYETLWDMIHTVSDSLILRGLGYTSIALMVLSIGLSILLIRQSGTDGTFSRRGTRKISLRRQSASAVLT